MSLVAGLRLHRGASAMVLSLFLTLSAVEDLPGQAPVCKAETCAYMNPALPFEQRAQDLVQRMTLEEKASQMQNAAVAIPRLGVPAYDWWNEALHGVARRGVATVFPQAIGMAATWDRELMLAEGETISTEARAIYNQSPNTDKARYYGLTFWSPNINIFRDPRWGRGQETYGEDPYLTGRMGTAFVLGVQGNDAKYLKAVATPKHFAVHSGPESLRHRFNVDVSPHDLEDTYLPAFRMAFVEGHADSVMCAYNAIDGAPACANTMLLQQHLVRDWGFKGFSVSDCDAVEDIATGHHFAADEAQASADAVKAGTDLDCGTAYHALPEAVKRGLVQEPELDAALVRLFTARFRLGMFDPPALVPWSKIAPAENDSAAHRALALRAARESIVLLKNDGVLPLRSGPHTIAVIGPTAESVDVMQGNYNGTASHPVYAREGLARRFQGARVVYAEGSVLAEGFMAPLPAEVLQPDAASAAGGLKAEYFDGDSFAGTAKATRTDAPERFDWRHVAPAPGVTPDNFAVRWTGTIAPPAAGDYTIALAGVRGSPAELARRVRFYLDGKQVMGAPEKPAQATLALTGAGPHAIRIEYVHAASDDKVSLQWQLPQATLLAQAVETASAADAVFAFVGLSPKLEGEEMDVHIPGFDGGDRTGIGLPAPQQQLLEALKRTGKPLVVVLNSGSALAVNWAQQNADAVLEAWYPGEEGGDAIAGAVAGDFSPSGRLPVTFYKSVDDLPAFTDYSMRNRTYRYFAGPVLYPFGYGLSYTKFQYSKPELAAAQVRAGDAVQASVEVRNTGEREADEVVEVYVKPPANGISPKVALAGFQRVHLAAGESRTVSVSLDARQMSEVDAEGKRAVVPGEYELWIGGGQPETGAAGAMAKFRVSGTKGLPE